MSSVPLVSIGLPVYNGERFIERALCSLLAQDYSNIEIVVSDNDSTDKTNEICCAYAKDENRIKIYKQKYNVGVISNFEKVVSLAHGEYFMWAAVDDYWLPSFISKLVVELEKHKDAGVAMSAVDRIRNDNSIYDRVQYTGYKNPNHKSLLGMALGLISSVKYNLFIYGVFRTQLLRENLPIPLANSGDRWFLLKISLISKFCYIDEVLHIRTINEKTYYQRYPGDDFARKKICSDNKWFHFELIPLVYKLIIHSKSIPQKRKIFIPIILSYLFYRRVVLGLRGILKYLVLNFFPKSAQDKIICYIKK